MSMSDDDGTRGGFVFSDGEDAAADQDDAASPTTGSVASENAPERVIVATDTAPNVVNAEFEDSAIDSEVLRLVAESDLPFEIDRRGAVGSSNLLFDFGRPAQQPRNSEPSSIALIPMNEAEKEAEARKEPKPKDKEKGVSKTEAPSRTTTYIGFGPSVQTLMTVSAQDVHEKVQTEHPALSIENVEEALGDLHGNGLVGCQTDVMMDLPREWQLEKEKVMSVFALLCPRLLCEAEKPSGAAIVREIASVLESQRGLEHFLAQVGQVCNRFDLDGAMKMCVGCSSMTQSHPELAVFVGKTVYVVLSEGVVPLFSSEAEARAYVSQPDAPVQVRKRAPSLKVRENEENAPVKPAKDETRVEASRFAAKGSYMVFESIGDGGQVRVGRAFDSSAKQELGFCVFNTRSDAVRAMQVSSAGKLACACKNVMHATPLVFQQLKQVVAELKEKLDTGSFPVHVAEQVAPGPHRAQAERLRPIMERFDNREALFTSLTPSFLDAQMTSVAVSITNHLDSENKKGKMLIRYLVAFLGAQKNADGVYFSELLSKAVLKELALDALAGQFIFEKSGTNHIGFTYRVIDGYYYRGGGFVAPTFSNNDLNQLEYILPPLDIDGLANLPAFPSLVLRGFADVTVSWAKLCELKPRVIFIELCGAPCTWQNLTFSVLFESSPQGALLRSLLSPLFQRFKKFAIVCAPTEWCRFWRSQLPSGKHITFVVRDGLLFPDSVPSPSWLLDDARTPAERAQGFLRWFKAERAFALRYGSKDKAGKKKDKGKPDIRTSSPAAVYFASTLPFRLGLDETLLDSEARDASSQVLSNEEIGRVKGAAAHIAAVSFAALPGSSSFVPVGVGAGVVARAPDATAASKSERLDSFLGCYSGPELLKLRADMEKLLCESGLSAVDVLEKIPYNLPIAVGRQAVPYGQRRPLVSVNVGQEYKQGWTFATHAKGPSQVVRFTNASGGLDLHDGFFACNSLPCDYEWEHGLEFYVACAACRESVAAKEARLQTADHISPSIPEKPSCAGCLLRWEALLELLRIQLLVNLRVAAHNADKVALLLWGDAARSVWKLIAGVSVYTQMPWLTRVALAPTDLPHPNRVAFAVKSSTVTYARRAIAEAKEFLSTLCGMNVNKRQRKEFYAQLAVLHPFYDPSRAVRNIAPVSRAAALVLRHEAAAISSSVHQALHLEKGALVDLRRATHQFFVQQFVQRRVAESSLWDCFPVMERDKKKETLSVSATPISVERRGDVLQFAQAVSRSFHRQLSLPPNAAASNEVGNSPGWKRALCKSFEKMALQKLLDLWLDREWKESLADLDGIVQAGADAFVQQHACDFVATHMAPGCFPFVFTFVRDMQPPAAVARARSVPPSKDVTKFIANDRRFQFVPSTPKVKTLPDVALAIGHISITPWVASEMIARASRTFVDRSVLPRDQAVSIVVAAYKCAVERELWHFGCKKDIVGQLGKHLNDMLAVHADGTYCCVVNSTFECVSRPEALLMALLDFATIVSPDHLKNDRSLFATTDGACVHLVATVEKAKSAASAGPPSSRTHKDVEDFVKGLRMGGGIDCGKGGIDVVIPNVAVQGRAAELAFAEQQLAAATEQKEKHPRNAELQRKCKELEDRVASLRMAPQAAKDLVYGERNRAIERGASCITKGQYRSEMRDAQQARVRERSLAVANACLRTGSKTGDLLQHRIKLQRICGKASDVDGIARRLQVAPLLICAYNAPAVRKIRREREMLNQRFVARCVHLITNVLPQAVIASGQCFPDRALRFPANSPVARASATIRGWERGVHVARARIAEADAESKERCYDASKPLPKLIFAIDTCPGKGQRTTSGFPFRKLIKAIIIYVQCRKYLADRVEFQTIKGQHFRSSTQAAGFVSWLSNEPDVEKRRDCARVQPQNLPDSWQGPPPRDFYVKYDAVTDTIKSRDPPAALTVARNAIGTFFNAPTPSFLRPE